MSTIIGGCPAIRTVGTKISRQSLSHSQGSGASMSTALIILIASQMGGPISTTLSSAVAGDTLPVYGPKRLNTRTLNLIVLDFVVTLSSSDTVSHKLRNFASNLARLGR